MPSEGAGAIPAEVRRELLALARRSVETFLGEGRRLRKGKDYPDLAPEPRGAFVTLKTGEGDLRGCIGTILPAGPLDETVVRMAVAAAVEDPRFPAVRLSELPRLRFEISALTVPEPVPDLRRIEVGRHGLIVTRGSRKGLLLPQVAPEWGWDREEFLRHTCLKAGLPEEAWRDPGTRVEWFEAEVWGEEP
ncbi:MAG: AmmeMemoRadiSam system protein A [Acidobacteriota bacterium]